MIQRRAQKIEAVVFSNLILEVTYNHFSVCLNTDQPHAIWDGTLHQDVETRKLGSSLRAILEVDNYIGGLELRDSCKKMKMFES